MLRKLSFTCFFLALLLFASSAMAEQLTPIKINDLEGNEIVTTDFLDKEYVIFEVWTTWCPSCVVSMKDFQENLDKLKENNLKVVAISLDDRLSTVENFVKEHSIEFTVLHDPRSLSAMQWNVRAIPAVFLVAPDGELLLRKQGYAGFDSFLDEVKEVIAQHIEAKDSDDKDDESQAMQAFNLEVVELETDFFRGFYDYFELKPMEQLSEENFDPVEGAMAFYSFFIGTDGFLMVTLNEGENRLPQHIHLAPFDEESQPAQTLHLENLADVSNQNLAGVGADILIRLGEDYQAPYHFETYVWDNGMAGFYALPHQGYRGVVNFEGVGEKEILLADLGGNTFINPAFGYILVDLDGDGQFTSEGVFRLSHIEINGQEFKGELDITNMQVKIGGK